MGKKETIVPVGARSLLHWSGGVESSHEIIHFKLTDGAHSTGSGTLGGGTGWPVPCQTIAALGNIRFHQEPIVHAIVLYVLCTDASIGTLGQVSCGIGAMFGLGHGALVSQLHEA